MNETETMSVFGEVYGDHGYQITFPTTPYMTWEVSAAELTALTELVEYAEQRGVVLSDERAGRAVAAGRGGDLRRRLDREE